MEPRNYQRELFELAKEENSIIYLGTGSGKTFISIMMIKEFYGRAKEEGKKIVMIVPSVPLVNQQSRVVDEQCKFARVGKLSGDDGVDLWDSSKWKEVVDGLDIIVMIHQVFLDALTHCYLNLANIALLIFDECHHTFKDNPYNMIMKEHYHPLKAQNPEKVPHIMGLSASVVITQCDNEIKFIKEKELLEKNLDSKIITTQDLDNYLRYVTQPFEVFEGFYEPILSGGVTDIVDSGVHQIEQAYLERLGFLQSTVGDSKSRMEQLKTKTVSKKKQYVRSLNDVLVLCNTLGISGSRKYVSCFLDDVLPHSKLKVEQSYELQFIEIVEKTLKSVRRYFDEKWTSFQGSDLQKIYYFMSPRVQKLLKIISEFVSNGQFSTLSFTAIVFVQRRETCRILYSLLSEIGNLDSKFSFLLPAYVVGQSMSDLSHEMDEMKKTDNTIVKFRSGDLNLIVATSVLEEGMDIKKCNLVIRFDEIQTYRSYVQSKGRARAKPSRFVIMHSLCSVRLLEEKINKYRNIEKMSIDQCHTIPLLDGQYTDDDEDEEEEEPYFVNPYDKANSAMVSSATSINLLYQYISSISTDKFTCLTPFWEYGMTTSRPQNILSSMLENPKFVCRVTLPHKTPLTTPIQGTLRSSQKKAKRSAALKACSMLHQIGELDDKLIPRMKNLLKNVDELDDGLDDDSDEVKPGTRRYRRYYGQKNLLTNQVPIFLSPKVFIYVMNMSLINIRKHNPKRYSIYDPQHNPRKLGICLSSPLPETVLSNKITLYSRSGLVEVNIALMSSHLSGKDLLDRCGGITVLQKFTNLIYDDVLRVVTPWMNRLNDSEFMECKDPLVVPLLNGNIDTSCIQECISENPCNRGEWTDRVVTLQHKVDPQRYFVEEVITTLTPSSNLNESTTFAEHYSQKYGMRVNDLNQPLIRLSNADAEHFAFSSLSFEVKDNKLVEMSDEEFIRTRYLAISELVKAHSVPSSLWKDLQLLPYILERINQIQCSLELFCELSPLHRIESTQGNDSSTSFDFLIDLEHQGGPSPGFNHFELFKSLTLTNAGEEFDLERNEVLGDSFLKIMTSIYLYFEVKLKDEGYLSLYRSRIVGNRNLLRIGEIRGNLNLGGILNAVKLQPRHNWQVPFFNNCKNLEKEIVRMNQKYRQDVLSAKGSMSSMNFVDVLKESHLKELKNILESRDDGERLRFYESTVDKMSKSGEKDTSAGIQMTHLRMYVPVSDKCIADAVEAIIGLYLLHNGCKATLQMMATKIGINLYPKVPVETNICEDSKTKVPKNWFTPPKDAIQDKITPDHSILNRLLLRLQCKTIEEKIGYTFKEKTFLLQAFTHSSFVYNNITDSYERLEFLGDAILDYLVSAYIFIEYPSYGPGKVTDARSAVVNNVTLALVTLQSQLHCHLLHSEPLLFSKIDAAIANVSSDNYELSEMDIFSMKRSLLGETECPVLEDIDVPKVLGDICESLLGAVFLDSGFDLQTVWKVFKSLCPQLDKLIASKPKNYVSKLYELYPQRVMFGPSKVVGNKVEKDVIVTLNSGLVYKARGIGPKGKIAKNSAAKCLLRSLVKIKELPSEML